jgi:hypothetical protein
MQNSTEPEEYKFTPPVIPQLPELEEEEDEESADDSVPSAVQALDPYQVLGVKADASFEECKKAFHVLAIEQHPDRNPDDPAAHEAFSNITEAFAMVQAKKLAVDTARRDLNETISRALGGKQEGVLFRTKDSRAETTSLWFTPEEVIQLLRNMDQRTWFSESQQIHSHWLAKGEYQPDESTGRVIVVNCETEKKGHNYKYRFHMN